MFGGKIRNVIGGVLFGAVGLYFLLGALQFDVGTAQQMGPGYFPLTLGALAVILATIIAASVFGEGEAYPEISWRPMVAVLGSVAVFALGIERVGLVPTTIITVGIAALGDRRSKPISTLVAATLMAGLAWGIFRYGLGLPVPAFEGIFVWKI